MKRKLTELIAEYKEVLNELSSHIPYYEKKEMAQDCEMEKLRIMTYKKIIYDLEKIILNEKTRPAGHLP